MFEKAGLHTERKVIYKQRTREDVVCPELAHHFSSFEHLIVVLVHLIAICYGED